MSFTMISKCRGIFMDYHQAVVPPIKVKKPYKG